MQDAPDLEQLATSVLEEDGWQAEAEKRRTPRFPSNTSARVLVGRTFGSKGWSRSVPAVACDVSAGGVMVASSFRPSQPLAKNTLVTMQLALGDDEPVVVHGRVAWIQESSDAWIGGIEVDDRTLPEHARSAWADWHLTAGGFEPSRG